MRAVRILSIVLLLICFVGCETLQEETVPTHFPLSRTIIRSFRAAPGFRWQQDIFVYLADDAQPVQLINPDLFAGLRPGETNREAQLKMGKPKIIRRSGDETWYRYDTALGYVEIGCEIARSSAKGSPCFWRLHAFTDRLPEYVFAPILVEQIRHSERIHPRAQRVLTVQDVEHKPVFDVWLTDHTITRVGLYRELQQSTPPVGRP